MYILSGLSYICVVFSASPDIIFQSPEVVSRYRDPQLQVTENYKYHQLKHTTTLFSLTEHDFLSQEWRVIVDQVQTNYNGRHIMVLQSVRFDRAFDFEGSSFWSDVS